MNEEKNIVKNPVLDSVKWLCKESKFVTLEQQKIRSVGSLLANETFKLPAWNQDCLPSALNGDSIEFFFLLNALNFKFWYTETMERFSAHVGKKYYGAFAMFALLKKWHHKEPRLLDGDFLEHLTIQEVREKLTGDTGPIPMLNERVGAMNEVGRMLTGKYGSFQGLMKKANFRCFNHGNGIVERLLKDFPSFHDSYNLSGKQLIFNKRAQLAPAMVFSKFRRTNLAPIVDINKLTVFADYQVPKGLLSYGILKYHPQLRQKILAQKLLKEGSREELEIRANTIWGTQLLIESINEHRSCATPVNILQLDYHLWKKGREALAPYHLTETMAY